MGRRGWRKSLERVEKEDKEVNFLEESTKARRGGDSQKPEIGAKRRKLEIEGVVWGESIDDDQLVKMEFLNSGREATISKSTQPKLKVLSGNTWMAHQLIKEVADKAVFMAWDMTEVARWDVWEGDSSLLRSPPTVPSPARGGFKIVKHSKNQISVKEFSV